MLKSMRNTIQKADNSSDGFGADMLEGMFDVEFSKHLSKNSNLGLADMLYRKLTGEPMPKTQQAKSVVVPSVKSENKVVAATQELKKENPVQPTQRELPKEISLPHVELLQARPTIETIVAAQQKPAVKDAVHVAKTNELKGDQKSVAKQKSLDERLKSYSTFIAEASEKHGVNENLIKAVIATESGARPKAESARNAKGLMQLVDSTATEMGVKNVWDPRENILGGAKYLSRLLEKFDGDEQLALASYNAGPANVIKHGGVPPFKETKEYVARVMNFMKLFEENDNE
jgi:soluble lytic murein transglycosylase-like protein